MFVCFVYSKVEVDTCRWSLIQIYCIVSESIFVTVKVIFTLAKLISERFFSFQNCDEGSELGTLFSDIELRNMEVRQLSRKVRESTLQSACKCSQRLFNRSNHQPAFCIDMQPCVVWNDIKSSAMQNEIETNSTEKKHKN